MAWYSPTGNGMALNGANCRIGQSQTIQVDEKPPFRRSEPTVPDCSWLTGNPEVRLAAG